MRLLKTKHSASGLPETQVFFGAKIPRYAILSHTWSQDEPEFTLQDLLTASTRTLPANLQASLDKITSTCRIALDRDELDYAWVDTCCIDKTSSAELSEAITSMYAWYRGAAVCYVFLADLAPGATPADLARDLPACRWFTRGWTLQELIAPEQVVFFDREWKFRGDKRGLAEVLSGITGIPAAVLRGEAGLGEYAVARRMSWAARRETTRVEDMAYCLWGIFDVNMPLLYGEGMKAFTRLQTAIVQSTGDLSILAWIDDRVPCPEFAGMLAESPPQFANCGEIETWLGDSAYANFTLTTRGIQTKASRIQNQHAKHGSWRVAMNTFCRNKGNIVGVSVRKIGGGLCARVNPGILVSLGSNTPYRIPHPDFRPLWVETLTLVTTLPSRYPLYPGLNPVLGNRCSVLSVNWGPFAIDDDRAIPRSHWDAYDRVFFCCNPSTWGWGAVFASGRLQSGSKDGVPVNLFLACFEWNRGTPTVVVASLDELNPTTRMFLELNLDRVAFESIRRAEALINSVFHVGVGVEEESISTEFGPVRFLRDSTTAASTMVNLRTEILPDVCVNPVVVLDLLPRGLETA